MIIQKCSSSFLQQRRAQFVKFIIRFGDQRITHKAIRWFKKLKNTESPGNLVAIMVHDNRLVGLTVFGNYGLDEAIIVVHPKYRKAGVGEQLVQYVLQELPKIYTRVACDNIPSLKLCFSCGLVAYRLIKGPTNKPTLCLAGGEWSQSDLNPSSPPVKASSSQR